MLLSDKFLIIYTSPFNSQCQYYQFILKMWKSIYLCLLECKIFNSLTSFLTTNTIKNAFHKAYISALAFFVKLAAEPFAKVFFNMLSKDTNENGKISSKY